VDEWRLALCRRPDDETRRGGNDLIAACSDDREICLIGPAHQPLHKPQLVPATQLPSNDQIRTGGFCMSRLFHNKKITILAVIGLLVAAGGAYAYWTATGSGTASSTVAAGGTITLNGTFPTDIAPGLTRTVTFQATNATSSSITVGTVHLVSVAVDAGHSTCAVADFTMPDVVENQAVAAGATAFALTTTGTLTMANTGSNQDACKGATLTLTLSSS
jgi:hypothetical protein